jgi:GMP synthase-like glutamine amidotransferase
VLQHVPFEGPGTIAAWARSRGHTLGVIALQDDEDISDATSADALVVLGGPMGVGDEARFPFLRAEKQLLRAYLEAGRPVLGICLGAQLLADVLGARVAPMGYREIGWFPLRWTAAARSLPGCARVPHEMVALHWHGDTFALPPGTIRLASSDACSEQGFATPGGRAVGLQFHAEMSTNDVAALVLHARGDLAPAGAHVQSEADILAGHARHGPRLQMLLDALLDGWIATGAQPPP